MEFERYRVVRREEQVAFIADALELSGYKIERIADPRVAPFVFSVVSSAGEPLELICYAFLANKYKQKNRPADEHRFQVKYGSQFDRFHDLYMPRSAREVTLMFGVHLEERVIVAVDPAMHNPTWFSRSVEFKTGNVEDIQRTGWCGWERERSHVRRKQLPLENHQTETILGLTAENFSRYIALERATMGIPPGERLFMIEETEYAALSDTHSEVAEPHSLVDELGLPAEDIFDMINSANRLKVAVRGRAAEKHLLRVLKSESALESVAEVDEDGQPDFLVGYRGKTVRIECKNTLRRLTRGVPKVDFQKTRASKSDPCSRYYRAEQFEVLAACLHPITANWEFRFHRTLLLPPHKKCVGHLSQNVLVDNGDWAESVVSILDAL